MKDSLVQSVVKSFSVLDILVFEDTGREGIGLFELARRIGQKPSTLRNILKTMIACGYVEQNGRSLYVAGPKCDDIVETGILGLGAATEESAKLSSIHPLVDALSKRLNESVTLAALINGKRIPILCIADNNPVRVDLTSEEMSHIYERTTGRVLVAFADDFSAEAVLSQWGYPGARWGGVEDRASFDRIREDIRRRGYALSIESAGTVVSMAVPVKNARGKCRYALGSFAPSFRCGQDKQAEMIRELQETAALLKNLL